MILNVEEISLFINHNYPYGDYVKFYGYLNFGIHLFLLCLSILIMTFYEDILTPILFWAFELGIFVNRYAMFYSSYEYYFVFFVVYTATIIYYFVSIIYNAYSKKESKDDASYLDMEANYNNNNNQ